MSDLIFPGFVLSMTSKEIAELTGKEHKNVLRDIDALIENLKQNNGSDLSLGISATYDGDPKHGYRVYLLDRDSTYCLIAGYDAATRMRIIKRWQELEAKASPLPKSFADALQLAADQQRVIEEQDARLALAAPKEAYYDQVAKTCARLDFSQVFSLLHGRTGQTFNRQTFLEFLRRHDVAKKENPYANIGRKRFVPCDAYRDSWFVFILDGPGPGEWMVKQLAVDGIIRLIEQDRARAQ
jgi:phage regulator Rha-like protein